MEASDRSEPGGVSSRWMGQVLETSGATRSGEGAEAAGLLLGLDELVFALLLLDSFIRCLGV